MAIDEKDVSADIAPAHVDEDGNEGEASAERGTLSLDDLRHRLDSPLFARDPALATPASVPRLRELTWEHVVNPTSSVPVVPSDPQSTDGADPTAGAAPKPLKIEDLLAAPADPFSTLSRAMPSGEQPAQTDESTPPVVADATVPVAEASPPVIDEPRPTRERQPAPALPSFAAMLSGETTEVRPPSEASGVDDLVKPIEEPPPVARDTDPEVVGLAELIMRSTPVTGMPRVEAVRDSLRNDTGAVPVVPSAEPVIVAPAAAPFSPPTPASGVANVPAAPPLETPATLPPPISGRHDTVGTAHSATGAQPAVAMSAVEAELNRLAYLPDQEEDLGPVEVPEIVYSDVRSAEPVAAAPVLSNAELYSPRQSAAPVRHAYTDIVEKAIPVQRRRKRHVLRKIVTFVVLAGMAAGGLFAVKYFVLDKVKWTDDIAPLAADVETARELKFDHDIPVTELPSADYETMIVESTHGITDETRGDVETRWRALGVLTGAMDTTAIGISAMVDQPAFYDPATEAIYVVQDLAPEVRTFALHRALTMALLDQQFGWGARIADAPPAVAVGTRALYESDALAVAQSLLTDDDRTAVADQLYALVVDNAAGASPSPFGSYTAGRLGLTLWPYFDAQSPKQRDVIETEAAMTDGQVLDVRRLVSGQAESAGEQSQGMLFWYHVLAARLDDDLAWNAALGWKGDVVTPAANGAASCVSAVISVDDAHAAVTTAAFDAWAAAAPTESTTAVSTVPGAGGAPTKISVTACDPGPAIATNDGAPRLSLGGSPLRVEQYRRLLDDQPTFTPAQAACAVFSLGDTIGGNDERGVVDPVGDWTTPSNHPIPDPVGSGCVTANP